MEDLMRLASKFTVKARSYATQANAILGIRDSGKTYTAMKTAEQLLDAGIPIVVYDPIGVWKHLRHGVKGNKGYPVLVAGGDKDADIKLTTDNAVMIMKAAMEARVSIIFDLYSPELANKSTWIKIVQDTVKVLMYDNRDRGIVHVYLEEAAEFIPQRIQPQQSKVYSAIEQLARMGRNSSIGLTIINQRAEEINKAILELCALVFLHKQVGKNSLLSIKKWLEVAGYDTEIGEKTLSKMLPSMKQGECLIIDTHSTDDIKLHKILSRKTFHPSPGVEKEKTFVHKAIISITASSALMKFQKAMEHLAPKKPSELKKETGKLPMATAAALKPDVKEKELSKTIHLLKSQNADLINQVSYHKAEAEKYKNAFTNDHTLLIDIADRIKASSSKKVIPGKPGVFKIPSPVLSKSGEMILPAPARSARHTPDESMQIYTDVQGAGGKARMLKAVIMSYPEPISKVAVALQAGISPTSGTFGTYYRELRKAGLIADRGGSFIATDDGLANEAREIKLPETLGEILVMWYGLLGRDSGLSRILRAVADRKFEPIPSEDAAEIAGISHLSGTFGTYYRKLRKKGLIETGGKTFRLAEALRIFDK